MFEHGSAPLLRDRELEINHIGRRRGGRAGSCDYLRGSELTDVLGFLQPNESSPRFIGYFIDSRAV